MIVGQSVERRSGMLRALSAGPCFREKCTESWRDEKSGWEQLFYWSMLSICSGGVKCVLCVKLVKENLVCSTHVLYLHSFTC